MANSEIHSVIRQAILFTISDLVSNGTFSGDLSLDLAGLGSAEFLFFNTTLATDGDFLLVPRHGDTNNFAQHVDVPVDQLVGPSLQILNSGGASQMFRQGYIGKKRFISVAVTATNVTVGQFIGCFVIVDTGRHTPLDEEVLF